MWAGQQCLHPAWSPGGSVLPRVESKRCTDLATGLSGLSKTSCPNPWSPGISSPQMSLEASRGVEMAETAAWLSTGSYGISIVFLQEAAAHCWGPLGLKLRTLGLTQMETTL